MATFKNVSYLMLRNNRKIAFIESLGINKYITLLPTLYYGIKEKGTIAFIHKLGKNDNI